MSTVLLVTAGCGGDPRGVPDDDPPSSAPPGAVAPEPKRFDPPAKFLNSGQTLAVAPRRGGSLGKPEVAAVFVGATLVYVDESSLAGRDLATGDERWVTPMPGVTSAESTQIATPALFEGRVYAAAAITVPTGPRVTSHRAISLVAVDPVTGNEIWTATIEVLPGDPVRDVRLVGVTADSIVLDTSTTTYVVDPQTRKTRWKTQFFEPTVVDGTVVAGQLGEDATETKTRTVGLRLTDGVQLWSSPVAAQQGRSFPLGPGLMAVQGREFSSTEPFFDFLDPATGQSRYPGDSDDLSAYQDCWFDSRTLVVCGASGTRTIAVGYNWSDLTEIWELPVGERAAPRVTAAWHGAVYGVLAGKPVILDGRTGAVRNAAAGAAPELVNEYAGVTAESGSLTLFPAIA
ncbi:PQQ-binding-like beta-propeller repeat protein [Cryptosporangium aurantiacum]|uniref:outer membrane protein assembly factor BamB family protein n=1 Tax=Cryptosporangium aurantiacum TaxID=134849 RepID=UPI001161427F|nr:PQQ-binding-like beta-propeller repeat protein [Cryptosporangium aurantiacum]